MSFPSHIFLNNTNHGHRAAVLQKRSLWLPQFYMAVATCCCYEKMRRTVRTGIASYLLKPSPSVFKDINISQNEIK